ncbi:hypothetical protein BH11ACT8_BH11ACT8_19070 [soil metagenome]
MSTSTQPMPEVPYEAPAGGRHPVVVGHLVMGVAFLGMIVVWALVASDAVQGGDIRFLLPAPWVLAGIAGLVALATSDRRRHQRRTRGWVDTSAQPTGPSATMEE